jgi:hypothetical protein
VARDGIFRARNSPLVIRRISNCTVLTVLFLLVCGRCAAANIRVAQAPQSVDTADHLFVFHSGMWINLHHFLYEQAAVTTSGPDATPREAELSPDASVTAGLSTDERAAWLAAVAYYRANLMKRSLVSDDLMIRLATYLEDSENATTLSAGDFDPPLIALLNQVGPIYTAHWWQLHNNTNQMWINALVPMVDQQGAVLSQEIATAFEGAWPDSPVRVDVVAYANFVGSYASLRPQRLTISSEDAGNQGVGALEMLFHAASALLIEHVRAVVESRFAAAKKTPPPELAEAILFFTSGYYVKKLYPDYTPYADRAAFWDRSDWSGDQLLLAKDWQPRLAGRVTLDAALDQLATDLVPRETPAS